jgi:hypothetical protein
MVGIRDISGLQYQMFIASFIIDVYCLYWPQYKTILDFMQSILFFMSVQHYRGNCMHMLSIQPS